MEILAALTMLCSSPQTLDKPSCEAHYRKCIDWIAEQPETKAKALTREEIALWLTSSSKTRALCR